MPVRKLFLRRICYRKVRSSYPNVTLTSVVVPHLALGQSAVDELNSRARTRRQVPWTVSQSDQSSGNSMGRLPLRAQ